MLIKVFDDKKQIISLWQEAFGDSEEEIIFFLDNCKHKKCVGLCSGKELYSMLFLVDCTVDGESAEYIYAASTFKRRRGNGDMSKILEYCRNNYPVICLIPADEELVKYYKKRGFVNTADTSSISFDESDEIKEYLFEGSELKKPYLMIYKES